MINWIRKSIPYIATVHQQCMSSSLLVLYSISSSMEARVVATWMSFVLNLCELFFLTLLSCINVLKHAKWRWVSYLHKDKSVKKPFWYHSLHVWFIYQVYNGCLINKYIYILEVWCMYRTKTKFWKLHPHSFSWSQEVNGGVRSNYTNFYSLKA